MSRSLSLPLILFAALLAGCGQAAALPPTPSLPSATAPDPTATVTVSPTVTSVPFTATPSLPTATPAPRLCSPLSGFALDQLAGMTSNPYHPPPPGSDDPHHGVDLAVRVEGSQVALSGNPVQAAIPGTVVMVNHDRFPYGSSVMIEVPLEGDQADWLANAGIPTPAPTLELHSALTCPASTTIPTGDPARRSLYVLYAHMQTVANLSVGDQVACGQPLGTVGDSGNALAPHLHFETRVGPSAIQLPGMAHYDVSATADEMAAYCAWRISGLFQLVDPMKVLSLAP